MLLTPTPVLILTGQQARKQYLVISEEHEAWVTEKCLRGLVALVTHKIHGQAPFLPMSSSLARSIRQRLGSRVTVQGYGQQYCLALNTDEVVARADFLQLAGSMFDADTVQALGQLHRQHQRDVATLSSQPQHPAIILRPMIRLWTNHHIHIYGAVGAVGALLTLIALLIVLLM